jgi:ribosomal protein S18 acetylase RimI-like enzyme
MAALAESPQAFRERTEEAAQRSDVEWDALAEKLAAQVTMAMVLVEREAEPIGMTFVFLDEADAGGARIGGVWVAPAERRQHLGKELVHAACTWVEARARRRIRLWVATDTAGAVQLYRSCGFAGTGVSKPFPGQEPRVIAELMRDLGAPTT